MLMTSLILVVVLQSFCPMFYSYQVGIPEPVQNRVNGEDTATNCSLVLPPVDLSGIA